MKTTRRIFLVAVVVVLLLMGVAVWNAFHDQPQRTTLTGATPAASAVIGADGTPGLHAELAASGLTRFKLTGGSGEMYISPSADDKVHVSLELRQQRKSLLFFFHWLSDDTTRDMHAAVLEQAREGDTLHLALVYPSGQDRSDIQESWKVQLPARLMVEAEMYAGELKVTGMQGGVKTTLTAGETAIEDVGGPVQAGVRYGRLHVISLSKTPGVINVAADHGLAVMDLDGKYYGPPEKHGFFNDLHLIGNSLAQRVGGADNMDLNVRYGEVDLRVGELGDVHDYRSVFMPNG